MAIFSEGGTSYPDILIVCYMIICSEISSLLNPAVFIYNYWRKKNSVPVFLFRCLAVLDFLTCIFIPVKVVIEAVKGECSINEDDQTKNCMVRIKFQMNANVPLRLYSFVAWILILTPNFTAAIMAICRFIQIRFPFYPLDLKHLTVPALVYGAYTLSLSSYFAFCTYVDYSVDMQTLTHRFGIESYMLHLVILIYVWPSIICQILSVVTSILTILHLYKTGRQPISEQSAAISKKSSLKILVLNFGTILSNIAMILCMTIVSQNNEDASSVAKFVSSVLTPTLMSCFNPVVFIMFNPEFRLSSSARPTEVQPTNRQ